ncbi:hypothetical protein [Kitasatospora sp. NBC_01539]|uniref:hypothetical protein n=1 Tax=Kitasatospora sp. NBC_01539 TaxID=2903577 RepID=UPI00386009CE
MTSDHAPTSGRTADSQGLLSQAAPSGRATPYRMTARTSLPFDHALALIDEAIAAWLKQEGHDEPPPGDRAAPAERFRLGDRVLLDRDRGPLPVPAAAVCPAASAGGTPAATASAPPGNAPPSDLAPPSTSGPRPLPDGPGPGPAPAGGRYARRRLRTPLPHGTQQLTLTLASVDPTADTADHTGRPTDAVPPDGTDRGRAEHVMLCLESDHLGAGSPVRSPARVPVPDLARTLVALLDVWDGPAELADRPRLITPAEVDDLIDRLCDPARRLAAIVVSPPSASAPEGWLTDQVQPVLRQLVGVASLFVLDHAALPLFNVAFEYHKVYGGAVRTYLPEVDPASRADSARHHVLPRQRMEEDVRRAAALLAREPRRIAAELALPAPLDGVPPMTLPPEARRPARPRPSAEAQRPRTEESRRAARHRTARPPGRLCAAGGLVVPAPAGADRPPGALLTAPAEAEYARLARDVAAEKELVPGSFGELVHRFEEFPLLEFTGDEKETLALDGQPDGAGWARLTWDGLTALQEYAHAAVQGQAGGDFKQWCEHTPAGCHHFPPRKAVRWESRTVESHAKWKRERMLPVPSTVDVTRRAFMGAHLRIGGGSTAPRLHYLDDCSSSGRIYVGYIGQHLTNTRTN